MSKRRKLGEIVLREAIAWGFYGTRVGRLIEVKLDGQRPPMWKPSKYGLWVRVKIICEEQR